jgi:hypothetical protein
MRRRGRGGDDSAVAKRVCPPHPIPAPLRHRPTGAVCICPSATSECPMPQQACAPLRHRFSCTGVISRTDPECPSHATAVGVRPLRHCFYSPHSASAGLQSECRHATEAYPTSTSVTAAQHACSVRVWMPASTLPSHAGAIASPRMYQEGKFHRLNCLLAVDQVAVKVVLPAARVLWCKTHLK